MAVVHIRALSGGIGTSTFAWCLARELGALLIDQSVHSDGVLWAAGVSGVWPKIMGTGDLSADDFDTFEEGLTHVAGVRVCAGGTPLPSPVIRQLVRSAPPERDVVIDGNGTNAMDSSWTTIVVVANSIPHMRELESLSADFVVCSMQSSALPAAIVTHLYPEALLFKKQRRVERGMQNGFGVDEHSDIARCAATLKSKLLIGATL